MFFCFLYYSVSASVPSADVSVLQRFTFTAYARANTDSVVYFIFYERSACDFVLFHVKVFALANMRPLAFAPPVPPPPPAIPPP